MFQGYPDETVEFFMAIRFNNNADFFHSNHDWYLRAVREPSLALAEALAPAIEELDSDLERRPNRVVSRINRDIRFTRDKSPYRDYLWLSFHQYGEDRSNHLEIYFDISADSGNFGMGYFRPERGTMNALRRRILLEPGRVTELFSQLDADFDVYTHSYKRMKIPPAVPKALKPLYAARGLGFQHSQLDFHLLKSPELKDALIGDIHRLTPMYRYLSGLIPISDEEILPES